MSPRKAILKDLNARQQNGTGGYVRPASIAGFAENPSQFQAAINALLAARLITGTKDAEGNMVVALNPHRLADVKKELRPWFARPFGALGAA